jgi:signal transduction histidine kinase
MDTSTGVARLPASIRACHEALELQQAAIAADLHDDLGRLLTQLHWALDELDHEALDERARQRVAHLRALVAEVENATQRVVRRLAPPDIDRLGLVEVCRRLAATTLGPRGIAWSVITTGAIDPLPPTLAIIAYRVVQEAITNIARHSDVSHAVVEIARDQQTLRLTITDDGPPQPASQSDRLGLRLMTERVRAGGGAISVTARPTGGWTIVAELPAADA